ncbi:Ubiquitin 3 binding protein But2 [Cordyceps fumosorosea ARSEF 2679]|uniref:Ubiquitin 3 binding protein But2 n=1 Tax=Cordyceps fumosorosea (strain ARSEF 2679) TaxID=1081104 RepID=A0A168E6A3_CORFA|nr:Ubiquitin 3 binding protein But2 [Cordyceps fumosorosea ARSEF 2679]OAA73427.1 Ubiquitin 3 binding protein But2 [Cordyceps fumosorosea ARSEF 2679]
MKSAAIALSLGAVANGLAVRGGCQLHLSAGGDVVGCVGEISSGQVRAGNGVQSSTFTFTSGGLTDDKGRGCWWTPPTGVLQCDEGQAPDTGFTIGCDGKVSWNGQTTFFECATGEQGQWNIYNKQDQGANCGKVTLTADGCHAACPPPPPPPPPPPAQTCPTNLNGPYEFPHLIIPVSKSSPDTAAGTSYFGVVNGDTSSIFNFDIPAGDQGKKCSLVFLFPKQADLETSSFTFSGDGKLDFTQLKAAATEGTTYNNQPGKAADLGQVTVAPGNSYSIATFDCPAGQRVAYEISAAGNTDFKYFQDYNPSPIGLYITKC